MPDNMSFMKALLGSVGIGVFLAAGSVQGQGQDQNQEQAPLHRDVAPRRPNVVFVLTDDQDMRLHSLQYMPFVRKHLIEQGTLFSKHYCTTAICCPSRVTLWTGRFPHNTNVTDVYPPYGGYPKFVSQGFNDDYFPVWLQNAGYNTYYTGKLFNAHNISNYNSPYPAGFTGSDFLLDPYTYEYLNSTFQRNEEAPRSYEGEYSTDVMAEKAYGFLDDAVRDLHNKPFFMTVAPVGPHSNVVIGKPAPGEVVSNHFTAPVAAERHQHLFEDATVPRTANFNPDRPSGANWLLELPQQNQSNVDYNDYFYRQRLRALQAIDELVDGIVTRLEKYGILHDTYVVYSSDNGYHIGQHRLPPGKTCGYEEDINVPLIVRGPGVASNHTTDVVTSHTDLAPTFLRLLGIPLREDFDGKPIPVKNDEIKAAGRARREHVNVEFWGHAISEGEHQVLNREHNTYKSIRLFSKDYNLYYSVWCNNEHELYDMAVDPDQMHNLLTTDSAFANQTLVAGLPIAKVAARLDALLFVLKSCQGLSCRQPWKQLHPAGDVDTLAEALSGRFDDFYETEQTRVKYNFCANGYLVDAEGPMWKTQGRAAEPYLRDGLRWEEWV
ncbi:alkaline-phosphatase-like protein [Xylaria sp. CBS 124048]|nr:alkaline-phosphatase-like protein [Xylaria sp. CBS 124048]